MMRCTFLSRLVSIMLVISFLLVPEYSPARADEQNPTLFKDINTHTSDSSKVSGLMEYDGSTYYFAALPDGPSGLWQSDGTPGNTHLIKSGVLGEPAYIGSSSRWWSVFNSVLYFRGEDDLHGEELWRTDGTTDGTYMMLDIAPGLQSSSPCGFVEMNGWLYFTTYYQLWRTDGDLVERVSEANQTADPLNPVPYNGVLYFSGSDAEGGSELWRYDGTSQSPQRFVDLIPGTGSSDAFPLLVHNDWLYFFAKDGVHGYALWVTDGTVTGTKLFSDLNPNGSMNPNHLMPFGGGILFAAEDDIHGEEVWFTPGMTADGQPVAPVLISDFLPGPDPSEPALIGVVGSKFLFFAKNSLNTYALWALTSPSASPELLGENFWPALNNACCKVLEPVMRSYQGKLLYVNFDESYGWELWQTDGTPAGTHLAVDVWKGPRSSAPSELALCGDRLCFPADDGGHGRELLSSNGTSEGTAPVFDLNTTGPGSFPKNLVSAGRLMYFLADDGTHGPELWRSDGTSAGTFMVRDIDPFDRCGFAPEQFTPMGSLLYFAACDSQHGVELWATDGQPGSAWRVTDPQTGAGYADPQSLMQVGHRLYFTALQNNMDRLWVLDPFGSIQPVKELVGEKTAYWMHMAALGDALIFFLPDNHDLTSHRVWRTDGTQAGTQVISTGFSAPGELLAVGSQLFFSAKDESNRPGLWKTDGTAQKTEKIFFPENAPAYTMISYLTNVNGQVYFFAIGAGYLDLYKTNAAKDGVIRIMSFSASEWQRSPVMEPIAYAGRLVFRMQKMDYTAVTFASDGTPAGTQPIPGEPGFVNWLTPAGPFLFFSKADPEHGNELWQWDGTQQEPVRVADINPGPASSDPADLLARGKKIYFHANDGVNGAELWMYEMPVQQVFLPVVSR